MDFLSISAHYTGAITHEVLYKSIDRFHRKYLPSPVYLFLSGQGIIELDALAGYASPQPMGTKNHIAMCQGLYVVELPALPTRSLIVARMIADTEEDQHLIEPGLLSSQVAPLWHNKTASEIVRDMLVQTIGFSGSHE